MNVVRSYQIGDDLLEVIAITFDGVREARGFRRAVTTTRHEYRINGRRVAKAVWLAVKAAKGDRNV